MSHRHRFNLANHVLGGLQSVSKEAMVFVPGNATWICECGAIKYVELKEQPQLVTQERSIK